MASRTGLNQIESEGKGVDNTSDGVGPQMPMNASRQLRMTVFLDNFMFNTSYFKQLEGLDGDRKSDHSDSESINEDDYQLVP